MWLLLWSGTEATVDKVGEGGIVGGGLVKHEKRLRDDDANEYFPRVAVVVWGGVNGTGWEWGRSGDQVKCKICWDIYCSVWDGL